MDRQIAGGIVVEFNLFLAMWAENLDHESTIASQAIFLSPAPSK